MRKFTLVLAGILAGGTAGATGAYADAETVSRTSDYTLSWSDSVFTGASAAYAVSHAYGASAFTDAQYGVQILPNAQNFGYEQTGGVTVSTPNPTPPYPATQLTTFSGDGTEGSWGWHYDTAAGASGSGLPITYGKLGNLVTLNFNVGGMESGTFDPPIYYYVFVYLPGNWTTEGTATGDYTNVSVNPLFSAPTFTYDPISDTTTVETIAFNNFTTGSPNLEFTLIGGAVPEPATWAMLIAGFGGLGFAGYRTRRTAVRASLGVPAAA